MDPKLAATLGARAKQIMDAEGIPASVALARAYREQAPPDLGKGNVDLNARPEVKNPDGSVSTVYSMTFGPEVDGKYVLTPGVRPGLDRQMEPDEAYDWYKKTGQHLGKFDSVKAADDYANSLHDSQSRLYPNPGK